MPQRTVEVAVTAQMSNYLAGMQRGSAATAALGKQAQTTGQLTQQFVGKVGGSISKLGNQIGGEFGLILTTVGDDIEKVSVKSVRLSTALQVGGGAALAAGLGLQQLGSGAVQATEQLDAAITASGDSVSDYSKKIDAAVASNENLGKSAEDTKQALATLIPAAGSTQGALDQMQVVTDLAAAKHESLATAATAVARILGGNGSRTLSVYGIHMDGIGSKTDQAKRALDQLGQKLDGQASASVDNFSGQVGVATTHLLDFVKDAAGPAGTALTIFGGAAEVAGAVTEILANRTVKHAAAQATLTAAQVGGTAATTAESAAIEAQTGLLITDQATIAALVEGNVAFATSADGVTVAITGEGVAAKTAAGGLSALAGAAGPIGIGIAGLTAELVGMKAAAGGIEDIAGQTKTLAQYTDAANISAAKLKKTLGASAEFGSSFKTFVSETGSAGFNFARNIGNTPLLGAITPLPAAVGEANKADQALAGLSAKKLATDYKSLADSAKAAGAGAGYMADVFPLATAALTAQGDATGTSATKTADLGAKFSVTAQNAANLKTTTDELEKSLSTFGATEQTVEGTTEGYYSALDAANKAIKANGKNIDDSTVKGRANNQTLYALAKSADDLAAANLKAKVPIDQVKASLDAQRQTFITVAQNMGYTAQAATDLANKLIGVTNTKYNFTLNGVTIATNNLNEYLKALNKIPGSVSTTISIKDNTKHAIATGGYITKGTVAHFATGGLFRGPGTGTSDSIHAMVSNGEVVNNAATVARLGPAFFQHLNEGGSPAPVYMRAPAQSGGKTLVVNVSLPISQSLIGNEDFLAKTVTTIVQKGVTSGVVSAGWNNH